MIIFDVLGTVLGSVLLAYLSFTNILAEKIEQHLLPLVILETSTPPLAETPTTTLPTPSEKLTLLSRMYAQVEGIPNILKKNSAFQDAASSAQHQANVVNTLDASVPLATHIANALVNILCEYKTDTYARTTTGTGFFIQEKGVILTNAHVAQFLLLKEIGTTIKAASCVVRSGNPAMPRYTAELLFISPTWISHNANLITEEVPRGTGEYDYALLYVSGGMNGETHPSTFPSLPIDSAFLPKSLTGAQVLTAGYPAEKLFRQGAKAELIPKVATTSIRELYTFGSNYADIFSVSASDVGEQGASGGPVTLPHKGTIGLIVTKGDEHTDGASSLRALTLSYVNRTIIEETGFSLMENAYGDLAFRGNVFKKALAPFLAQLLEYELRD